MKKGSSNSVSASCLIQCWCTDWLERHVGKAPEKNVIKVGSRILLLCFYRGKNNYPLVKKSNNFWRTVWLFKNCILARRECQKILVAVRVLISTQSAVKCVAVPLVVLGLLWLCIEAARTLGRLSSSWRQDRTVLQSQGSCVSCSGVDGFLLTCATHTLLLLSMNTFGKAVISLSTSQFIFFLPFFFFGTESLVPSYTEFSFSRFTYHNCYCTFLVFRQICIWGNIRIICTLKLGTWKY